MVAFAKPYRKVLTPDRSAKDSGHRFYSAEISRWLSRDPVWVVSNPTRYGFVANSPISLYDILGLYEATPQTGDSGPFEYRSGNDVDSQLDCRWWAWHTALTFEDDAESSEGYHPQYCEIDTCECDLQNDEVRYTPTGGRSWDVYTGVVIQQVATTEDQYWCRFYLVERVQEYRELATHGCRFDTTCKCIRPCEDGDDAETDRNISFTLWDEVTPVVPEFWSERTTVGVELYIRPCDEDHFLFLDLVGYGEPHWFLND